MHSLAHGSSHPAAARGHVLGSPHLYDLMAEFFFFGRRRATYQALIAAVGIQPGQRVLDVGCGTGYFVRLIAEAVGPNGLAVGIEPSTSMINYAIRKAVPSTNSEFHVGTAASLELQDNSFDVVVSSLVMHHLPQDLRTVALQEMRRVLRPGGRVLVAEARSPSPGSGWHLLARLHGYDRMAREVPDLESIAARSGFRDIRYGEVPPWLRYVAARKP
jgi:ubiquinone/menaquinone biosynthesis C-methylase UbiE